jgi:hypothetical protein
VLSQEIRGRAIQIQDARFNEPMVGIATWQAVFVGDGCTIESYPMVVRTQVGLGLTKKWFCSKSLLDDRGNFQSADFEVAIPPEKIGKIWTNLGVWLISLWERLELKNLIEVGYIIHKHK